ncbi:hypothetical protein [Niallia circulans]|uniref:hypothetical protein n=1 Tax=Niallia circulans TaxID=1397 RepID=UPI00163987CE|nr:hypothetical protein [Niallia circulans]
MRKVSMRQKRLISLLSSFVICIVLFNTKAAAADQYVTTATAGVQSQGIYLTISNPQILNPLVTVSAETQKIVLAKFPEIKVEDLTGTNSAWSLKLSATPLTEKAPAGGFKSGTSAIVRNTIQYRVTSEAISNTNITRTVSGAVIDKMTATLYGGTQSGTTTINAVNEITTTITPNKNMVDLINYPTTPTPYETTITFSVVQGL